VKELFDILWCCLLTILQYLKCKWQKHSNMLCSTDTDRRISIGPIRIRGYVKFLQNLKAQRCIGVSDTDTRIRIGYVIRGHVEVSGLQRSIYMPHLCSFGLHVPPILTGYWRQQGHPARNA